MGDRGNIRLMEAGGDVWLYTHWRGDELPTIVRDAIKVGRPRWDDPPYLNRIIADMLINRHGEETGFGISSGIGDNQHWIVTVDHQRKMIAFTADGKITEAAHRVWPYLAYVELTDEALTEAFDGRP